MKFEKINDNQIRCTLTRTDLVNRELKISELAYGSPKAKALFEEMMTRASDELGFEVENMPLMIEAVPVSGECIMFIITKVSDPEELDTRFSKFTDSSTETYDEDSDEDEEDMPLPAGAGSILDILKQLSEDIAAKKQPLSENDARQDGSPEGSDTDDSTHLRIFDFISLDHVTAFSHQIRSDINCSSILYKNPKTGHFILVLTSDGVTDDDYSQVCRLACEFGHIQKGSINTLYYFDEHYEMFIRHNALGILRNL